MIYLELFYEFFIIGLFTFGGGYAMIPLIKETVITNEWLTIDEFYRFVGVCESTPGPIAVNMATYVGSTQGGFLGSMCATFGVVLPSFIIILLIAMILKNFVKNQYFKRFIKGVKPVIMALIISTGVTLLIKCVGINIENFEINMNYVSLIVFTVVTGIYLLVQQLFKKKLTAVQIILISAFLGIIFSYIFEK